MITSRRYVLISLVLTALAISVWAVMLLVTLPHLSALSGGLPVFDMRMTGYGIDEARQLLTALGSEGTAYYVNVQQRLDLVFPLLFFATVGAWILYFARRPGYTTFALPVPVLTAFILLGVGCVLADYAENGAVRVMIALGPDKLDVQTVGHASSMTVTKYGTGAGFLLILFVEMAVYLYRRGAEK